MQEIHNWLAGYKETAAGSIPIVNPQLTLKDKIGSLMVHWKINRKHYRVPPGLYAIGNPGDKSFVFVTANYKLSFDKLRAALAGMDAWILVLDTKGINVWCAAGEGTFGSKELIERIMKVSLSSAISHKTLILPQLGATGVSAHLVKKISGFKVVYGPVRAADIPAFIKNNFKKTDQMREVTFDLKDRLKVAPVEVAGFAVPGLIILIFLFLFNILVKQQVTADFFLDFLPFLAGIITGTILFPILLPYLPTRSFAVKGGILGFALSFLFLLVPGVGLSMLPAFIILITSITSFLALNFTGATTFTSLAGVRQEVRIAVPIQGLLAITGIALTFMYKIRLI